MEENATKQYVSERYDKLEDSYNTILLRLDPSPTLADIQRKLRREINYDAARETWYKQDGLKPLMSEKGIADLMGILSSKIGIPQVLSKLTVQKINQIVRETGEDVESLIFYKYKEYEIDEGDVSQIFHIVTHGVDIFLHRAEGGTENELLNRSMTHRENITQSMTGRHIDQPQQRPMFQMRGFRR